MPVKYVIIDIRGFLFLTICSALFDIYGHENISKIKLTDDENILISLNNKTNDVFELKDAHPELMFVLETESVSIFDSLSNCIDLIKRNITPLTLKKLEWERYVKIPKSLYKYVSNRCSYLDYFFKGTISFVHKNTFDDKFDCEVKDFFLNEKLVDKMRVLCLSLSREIKAMWGAYANGFNGFCFSYVGKNIIESIYSSTNKRQLYFICCNEVSYNGVIKTFKFEKNLNKGLKTAIDRVKQAIYGCYSKDQSWSYQKEYRFIVLGDFSNFNENYVNFEIKPSSYFYIDEPFNMVDKLKIRCVDLVKDKRRKCNQ